MSSGKIRPGPGGAPAVVPEWRKGKGGPVAAVAASFLVALAAGFAMQLLWGAPPQPLASGNRAYADEKYDRALELYDKAKLDYPESEHAEFNRGDACYRKGDYAKALEAFEAAALRSDDAKIEARAFYNMGNCRFREAEEHGSDLKKALEAVQASVREYQRSLRLDPDLADAAHNIEVARLWMRDLLDRLQKQQEEAKERQQKQQEALEKLKKLIEEQKAAVAGNREMQERPENPVEEAEKLAQDQDRVRRGTDELAAELEEMEKKRAEAEKQDSGDAKDSGGAKDSGDAKDSGEPGTGGPESPSNLKRAKERLDKAGDGQDAALERLALGDLPGALPAQEDAAKELEEALRELQSGSESQSGAEQAQPQSGSGQPQSDAEQARQSGPEEAEAREAEENEGQRAEAARRESARAILEEERRNQKERPPEGYRPVEKDW